MACPYLDHPDLDRLEPGCREAHRLTNLGQALDLCGHRFDRCPIFQRRYARESGRRRGGIKELLLRTLGLL